MKYVKPFGDKEQSMAEGATPESRLVAESISPPQSVSGVKEVLRPPEQGLVVSLHKGSLITGQLTFQGPAMIDGNVEGEIHCHGKLIIGEKADVRAKISGQIITIQGHVEGNVTAEEVELTAPAQLCGNVVTRRLIINEGAVFDGDCSMGVAKQNSEVASTQRTSAKRVEAAQSPKLYSDSAQELASKPTFMEGDSWQFNTTRSKVVSKAQTLGITQLDYTQGKVKAFSVEGDTKTEINLVPGDTTSQVLLAWLGLSEELQTLRFPLSVGQKWDFTYETRLPGLKNPTRRQVEITVTGVEQVTTPAGTFKAFKLVREETWMVTRGIYQGSERRNATTTYYYSPETKSIIRSTNIDGEDNPSTTELIKFTPGK